MLQYPKKKQYSIKIQSNGYQSNYTSCATYGGKLFGILATRCKPIQQVVDVATRTLKNVENQQQWPDSPLTLPDMNRKTAIKRTRAFSKCINSRTWISDLIKSPYKH
ncbi:hypothetical protein BB561_002316 [Smittium simulii]|uniref:Uncharacterized protein n=1 Tax=Smittium simulii TaxID=133385 RepID=A0A2T9YQV3_9FUNG|nr:hypothetical protein BB561_002316 [Smittium simulii]